MTHVRRVRSIVFILVAVTLVITPFGAAPAASQADGRWILLYLTNTNLDLQKQILEGLTLIEVDVTQVLTLINALAIKLSPGTPIQDLLDLLKAIPLADPVEAHDDIVGLAAEVISMTMAEVSAESEVYDWGAYRIGAPVDETGAGVMVAIVDTGIDCGHPELSGNIVSDKQFSAFSKTGGCTDENGHGTHVAGIAAARRNSHATGVAPDAKLVPVQVLDRDARGFLSDVIAGLQHVHKKGIGVVNMSFGFNARSVPLEKAIKRLYKDNTGMIMVASAGNCGWADDGGGDGGGGNPPKACDNTSQRSITYPAAYAEVIAVAATNNADAVTKYSRSGREMAVAAPGDGILSTDLGSGYAEKSGTSMAAAHVSGAVALLLEGYPQLSRAEVVGLLKGTANPHPLFSSEEQGAGLIDLREMLPPNPLIIVVSIKPDSEEEKR